MESRLRFFGIYRDSDFLQICVIASHGDARQARLAAAANGLARGKGYHAREMNREMYGACLERAGFSVTHSGDITLPLQVLERSDNNLQAEERQ